MVEKLYPKTHKFDISRKKLSSTQQTQINKKRGKTSLRELAKQYRVSHETIRRNINEK
ncbi:DeoR family transcriptional regulator [Chloroflexota bacterium]